MQTRRFQEVLLCSALCFPRLSEFETSKLKTFNLTQSESTGLVPTENQETPLFLKKTNRCHFLKCSLLLEKTFNHSKFLQATKKMISATTLKSTLVTTLLVE